MKNRHVNLEIFRFDPYSEQEHWYQTVSVPYTSSDQLLDLLEHIKTKHDSSLNYRKSCRHGICGSCAMKVNGKPVLACQTPVRDLVEEFGHSLSIDPLNKDRVIRDLVSDMDDFWEKFQRIQPHLRPVSALQQLAEEESPALEELLFPGSMAAIGDADHCIHCGACYYVCPVVQVQENFLGPSALLRSYRFIHDPRDRGSERLTAVSAPGEGVWECIKCLKCTEVCPKQIDPFSKISRLHSEALRAGAVPAGSRRRHTIGFSLDIQANGLLNELPLSVFALRFGLIRMLRRGIKMFLHGKIILNPLKPRSRGHSEIRKLMRNSE